MNCSEYAKIRFRDMYLAQTSDKGTVVKYKGTAIVCSINENHQEAANSEDGRTTDKKMQISISLVDVPDPKIADSLTVNDVTYQVVEIVNIDNIMGAADLMIERQDDIEKSEGGFRRK